MLNEMMLCEELFHTPSGVAFADFITNGHRETWPIRSKHFRNWLRRCYYNATGVAAGAAVIGTALDLLEARSQFDAPERSINIRVAEHNGRLYLDLADEYWRAVAIGPDGWRVLGCPPVRFRRSPGMLLLPVPERGGSVEALRPFLNLSNQNDFVLIVSWLLAALRSGGPYPLLAVSGEQGSAKTVLSKLLRALIDPNVAAVRALPREERELMIAANNGHLLAFDNLSGLSPWLSDALCRLASGGSFAVRQLNTDDEEVLFKAARPSLLNGIEDVIGRPDLADRAIFLTLGPIREEQRRSESELWREFELARPAILGALLDAAAHGLKALGSAHLDRLPRMADFALWATACETGLWPPGTFTRAYTANRKAAIEGIIDADPIAACVREFMSERSSWAGSAADLLRVSVERTGQASDRTGWPKIRAPSPGTCVGRRHFCGRSASTLPSVVKGDPEAESSGCARLSKIPSAPSAKVGPNPAQNNIRRARQVLFATTTVDLPRAQPCRCPVRRQTMLTVLTQKPAFLSGNWDKSYWRPALVPSCTSYAPSGFECHGRLWDWILLACVLAQFDKIKIDRSFVRNMAESEESAAIVRAVAGLARSLNIVTVVERVETSAQLEMVRSQGCDECQGYLLGRPMPETEVRSILDVHMRTASAA